MPITWRNVQAANFSGASQSLARATDAIGGAFSGLQQVNRDVGAALQENTDQNSREFLDQIDNQFSTPEALQQAQQSGELDRLQTEAGRINTDIVNNGAIDNLIKGQRRNKIANDEYADHKLEQDSKGLKNQIALNRAAGDFEANRQLFRQHNIHNEAALIAEDAKSERLAENDTFNKNIKTENQELAKQRFALQTQQDSRNKELYRRRIANMDREDRERAERDQRQNQLDIASRSILSNEELSKANYENELASNKDKFRAKFGIDLNDVTAINATDNPEIMREHRSILARMKELKEPRTHTQLRNDIADQLIDRDPSLSLAEARQMANPKAAEYLRAQNVSNFDLAPLQAEVSRIENSTDYQSELVTEAQSKLTDSDKTQRLLSVLDEEIDGESIFSRLGSSDGPRARREIRKLIRDGGQTTVNYDGQSVTIPIPLTVIEQAIREAPDSAGGFLGFDRTLNSVIQEQVNAGNLSRELDGYLAWQRDKITAENNLANANGRSAVDEVNAIDVFSDDHIRGAELNSYAANREREFRAREEQSRANREVQRQNDRITREAETLNTSATERIKNSRINQITGQRVDEIGNPLTRPNRIRPSGSSADNPRVRLR